MPDQHLLKAEPGLWKNRVFIVLSLLDASLCFDVVSFDHLMWSALISWYSSNVSNVIYYSCKLTTWKPYQLQISDSLPSKETLIWRLHPIGHYTLHRDHLKFWVGKRSFTYSQLACWRAGHSWATTLLVHTILTFQSHELTSANFF